MPTRDEALVIFNPAGGRGLTRRRVEKLRPLAPPHWTFRPTEGPGHAEELARQAVPEGFGTVIAAGGDGTAHEVVNGLFAVPDPAVTFAVLPCGSANDYAYSLGWRKGQDPRDWLRPGRPILRADVGLVTAPDGRRRYYIDSMGVGFNAAVTVEARKSRWLRGLPLYSLAFIKAMFRHFATPTMTVTFDDASRTTPTLALTINLGRREGGFLLTPDAKLDDGLFDYLHAGPLSRWELLKNLPNMATGKLPTDHPLIATGRCRRVVIESETPFRIHLDGEFFCHPEDNVRRVEVAMLPGRLAVETFAPTK
jgi:diacylglycerol kinase (ATP)